MFVHIHSFFLLTYNSNWRRFSSSSTWLIFSLCLSTELVSSHTFFISFVNNINLSTHQAVFFTAKNHYKSSLHLVPLLTSCCLQHITTWIPNKPQYFFETGLPIFTNELITVSKGNIHIAFLILFHISLIFEIGWTTLSFLRLSLLSFYGTSFSWFPIIIVDIFS